MAAVWRLCGGCVADVWRMCGGCVAAVLCVMCGVGAVEVVV